MEEPKTVAANLKALHFATEKPVPGGSLMTMFGADDS